MVVLPALLAHLLCAHGITTSTAAAATPPPLPVLPVPSYAQLRWQLSEMALFLHFGPNTFTDSEWGTGHADPSVFAPSALDAGQWARVAAAGGFGRVVLTAKHHDGFCLWPSALTEYSVAASPWRGGEGDVVGDLAAAARAEGIGLGLYLSPWDRHEPVYGDTVAYNEHYMGQMTELLTRYGDVEEVWLDGAKGDDKKMNYMFDAWFALIHQLQQRVVIFSDAGPDTRWVGDEAGIAGSTCWSSFNKSSVTIGQTISDKQCARGGMDNLQFAPANVLEDSIYSYWAPQEGESSWEMLFDLGRSIFFQRASSSRSLSRWDSV
ncbi:hypothetical protein PR202_ga19399 [Eleusine coracana subsp. coracana]|uniref:alpha-L-fucosidase n=1 Tax=Eleusine coracana subsp. coracana TaxID=191504 RepID=A0AAV5CV84_ELECO|nr:hypothetical protein PR202_ga19399 [Eleusine coracana subsp. coracana]